MACVVYVATGDPWPVQYESSTAFSGACVILSQPVLFDSPITGHHLAALQCCQCTAGSPVSARAPVPHLFQNFVQAAVSLTWWPVGQLEIRKRERWLVLWSLTQVRSLAVGPAVRRTSREPSGKTCCGSSLCAKNFAGALAGLDAADLFTLPHPSSGTCLQRCTSRMLALQQPFSSTDISSTDS